MVHSAKCPTCGLWIQKKVPSFVNYISLTHINGYGYCSSTWPKYLTDKGSSPVGIACKKCNSVTLIDTTRHLVLPGKILCVELAPDAIDKLVLFKQIEISGFVFELKALVRCYNNHFTCATHFQNKWNYYDDVCHSILSFKTVNDLTMQYTSGWLFCIFIH